MSNRETPRKEKTKAGAAAGEASAPAAHLAGPLFSVRQDGATNETDNASPYPWDEPEEPGPDEKARTQPGTGDDLPKGEEVFEPAADRSELAGQDPTGGFKRLNENVGQLFETVDAVAADAEQAVVKLCDERFGHEECFDIYELLWCFVQLMLNQISQMENGWKRPGY